VLVRRGAVFGQEQTMAAGLEKVREIAERVAQSNGLEVVDIELLGDQRPSGYTNPCAPNPARKL